MHKLLQGVLFLFAATVYSSSPEFGTLRILGEPGENQKETKIYIERCLPDPNHFVVKASCKALHGTFELQKPIQLPVGDRYYVVYANSEVWVQISAGNETAVSLKKLTIEKSGLPTGVFIDVTNKEEEDKYALWSWAHEDRTYDRIACSCANYQEICQEIFASPERRFKKNARVTGQGTVEVLRLAKTCDTPYFKSMGKPWIYGEKTFPSDKESFISLFPGVYGLSYWHEDLGISTEKFGVVVQ